MSYLVILAMLLVIVLASVIALFLLIGAIVVNIMVRVPYAPTQQERVKKIIDQFNLQPGQKFYDIGCGDGRMLLEAEKRGATAIGFEISPWAFLKAKLNIWLNQSSARVLYKNFYHVTMTDADAVFCFLINTVMPTVEKKLRAELRPGATVVSYAFPMPTWQPTQVLDVSAKGHGSNVYVYVKN